MKDVKNVRILGIARGYNLVRGMPVRNLERTGHNLDDGEKKILREMVGTLRLGPNPSAQRYSSRYGINKYLHFLQIDKRRIYPKTSWDQSSHS